MPNRDQQEPLEPRRVREFAHFFKRYMSISSVVAAALPVPVTALGLIPTFSAQTYYLSTYTSMFCFLCLGFVFYTRHQLAPRMFPEFLPPRAHEVISFWAERPSMPAVIEAAQRVLRMLAHAVRRMFIPTLPFLLILAALYCSLKYQETLSASVRAVRTSGEMTPEDILKKTPFDQIPFSMALELYYMGIFITAESAFILMAIKEYLQDLIELTDRTILTAPPPSYAPTEIAVALMLGIEEDLKLQKINLKYLTQLRALTAEDLVQMARAGGFGERFLEALRKQAQLDFLKERIGQNLWGIFGREGISTVWDLAPLTPARIQELSQKHNIDPAVLTKYSDEAKDLLKTL